MEKNIYIEFVFKKHFHKLLKQNQWRNLHSEWRFPHSEWRKFSVDIFLKEGSKRFSKKVDGEISIQNGDVSILNGENSLLGFVFKKRFKALLKKK